MHFTRIASSRGLRRMISNKLTMNEPKCFNGIGKVISTDDLTAVSTATAYLNSDKVIALPTDTVYGLACNANSKRAIQNLYQIKGRNEEKPVAICVADFKDFYHWGDASYLPIAMLRKLLPGPVTIVVKKSSNLDNPFLNNGILKVGIRIPDFQFIRDLCRSFRDPIALSSANRSSEKSTLNVEEFKDLWEEVGAVFDGGQLGITETQRSASTVIDLSEEGSYKVIRQGVAVEHTENVVKSYGIFPK